MLDFRTIALLAVAFLPSIAGARDYRVSAIVSFSSLRCNSYYNGWFTTTTGPCSDFKPPSRVALGETFSERGRRHEIKIIIATQVEEDYDDGKLFLKRGEWFCAAAETLDDLGDQQTSRTWLVMSKCVPIQ